VTELAIAEAGPATAPLPIGAIGPAFDGLLGTDGRTYGVAGVAGRNALVVVFSSNRCPTAKAYDGRLAALQREYAERGVGVVAINSNDPHLYPDESYERMVERATEGRFTFPYVVDAGQAVAKACGATCMFHVFVFDPERRLRYRGRFDDSRIPERVTSHDLRDALDDVLAGREVARPTTTPFGCSLDFV
jgi:hypothetical protein